MPVAIRNTRQPICIDVRNLSSSELQKQLTQFCLLNVRYAPQRDFVTTMPLLRQRRLSIKTHGTL
eukprot:2852544-Pleurochrysis_carterae.AAC.5